MISLRKNKWPHSFFLNSPLRNGAGSDVSDGKTVSAPNGCANIEIERCRKGHTSVAFMSDYLC